jgi:hypothetical protein
MHGQVVIRVSRSQARQMTLPVKGVLGLGENELEGGLVEVLERGDDG